MNSYVATSKLLSGFKLVFQVNFVAAIIFLVIISALSLGGSEFFFVDDRDLYGPLAGNLRLMLAYLCLSELSVCGFAHLNKNDMLIAVMGVFLLLLVGSLQFYGYVNQIPVDNHYSLLFLYLGISHIVYAMISLALKQTENN